MDYDLILEGVLNQKTISENEVRTICQKITQILINESNLLQLETPINIIGDVHGQFYDVLKIFSIGGNLLQNQYLFIGDYVDRGYHSIQTVLLLFLYKIKYPDRIYLLRGNHQSRQTNFMYGFYEESNKKYGSVGVWKIINDAFDYLPLAAVVGGSLFCVHGGLSPDIHALDQIRDIDRVIDVPTNGPFADLMWSDPEQIQNWSQGSRGAGWLFGYRVVNEFNQHNNLKLIVRAHQLVESGYKEWFKAKNLVTIWSAPNYCYRCSNMAVVMKVNQSSNIQYQVFEADQRSQHSIHYSKLIPYFL